jgi:MerR family copper efflux transcriptional regulator
MQAMADTLRHLSDCCAGDDLPDCPILADLAGGAEDVGGLAVAASDGRFGR